jgi:hypothetical protein
MAGYSPQQAFIWIESQRLAHADLDEGDAAATAVSCPWGGRPGPGS